MLSSAHVIETDGLSKRYREATVVSRLDLRVAAGRITAFLGRNGAGKSTTIRMLLGMVPPTAGTGAVLGYRIDKERDSREIRRRVAYVAEDKQTYTYMTVAQVIGFTRAFYEDWQPDAERRLVEQYALPLKRRVKELSKGTRTKLALLLALARRPALLILDEPSEGLDPVAIEGLLQSLVVAAADGTAVFFSSHQIAEAERIADDVCIIDNGCLVLNTSLETIRQTYRRIDLGFNGEPPEWALDTGGVTSIRTRGRQITVMSSGDVDALVEHGYALGAVSVDTAPVGLREVFLSAVGEPV
jgi:ABC-2 type transport system ATP-binding protein